MRNVRDTWRSLESYLVNVKDFLYGGIENHKSQIGLGIAAVASTLLVACSSPAPSPTRITTPIPTPTPTPKFVCYKGEEVFSVSPSEKEIRINNPFDNCYVNGHLLRFDLPNEAEKNTTIEFRVFVSSGIYRGSRIKITYRNTDKNNTEELLGEIPTDTEVTLKLKSDDEGKFAVHLQGVVNKNGIIRYVCFGKSSRTYVTSDVKVVPHYTSVLIRAKSEPPSDSIQINIFDQKGRIVKSLISDNNNYVNWLPEISGVYKIVAKSHGCTSLTPRGRVLTSYSEPLTITVK